MKCMVDSRAEALEGATVGGPASLTPTERAKRFWTAHGRSPDGLTVLHAFSCNPAMAWTPDLLCLWYGIRIDRAHRIVDELARCGVVRRASAAEPSFRWNDAHDWAVPRTAGTRWIVQERWARLAGCPNGASGERAPGLAPRVER